VADFWPLVNRCGRRLVSTSNFLSEAGRLQLVNAVFSALPTFAMCTFLLPKTVIKQIDRFRKHYLWRGSNINSKKPPKAAWKMVCDSKENGGLGVLDLRTHNECLLLKNLHKFYNKADLPWVHLLWNQYYQNNKLPISGVKRGSFWWKDTLSLLDTYKGMTSSNVRNGHSSLLWLVVWDSHFLSEQWPQLFSFVRNQHILVHQAFHCPSAEELFHLPLFEEAFQQFQELTILLNDLSLQEETDIWTYIWGSTAFTSSKAYSHRIGSRQVHPVYKWLWKSSCQNKRKVFFWLWLKDRLNTELC